MENRDNLSSFLCRTEFPNDELNIVLSGDDGEIIEGTLTAIWSNPSLRNRALDASLTVIRAFYDELHLDDQAKKSALGEMEIGIAKIKHMLSKPIPVARQVEKATKAGAVFIQHASAIRQRMIK